jgi:hypothetical protein
MIAASLVLGSMAASCLSSLELLWERDFCVAPEENKDVRLARRSLEAWASYQHNSSTRFSLVI